MLRQVISINVRLCQIWSG